MHKKRFAPLFFAFFGFVLNYPPVAAGAAESKLDGRIYADFNLRYESVEETNTLKDASALTLRSRLGYESLTYSGFSGTLEFEDSRIVGGIDEFTVGPTGFNPGVYSVIADPETTELDQGFIKYAKDLFTAKLGRQVITHDGHRFVGHVGWRQDRQTFDGLTLIYTPMEALKLDYSYIDQRNRIFVEAADINSKDHLLKADYKTPVGTLGAYAYLLEIDNNIDNALDTYGLRFKGSHKSNMLDFLYMVEFATQEATAGATQFDADYLLAEGGIGIQGITAKVGYELLGSDNGKYGFSTPLATLHIFNGWADQFLVTPNAGLEDVYVSVDGKLAGGKWSAVYHDFSADTSSATIDDFGSEVDLLYVYPFKDSYKVGVKYAAYSAGDTATGKVDTDKLWVWLNASF